MRATRVLLQKEFVQTFATLPPKFCHRLVTGAYGYFVPRTRRINQPARCTYMLVIKLALVGELRLSLCSSVDLHVGA